MDTATHGHEFRRHEPLGTLLSRVITDTGALLRFEFELVSQIAKGERSAVVNGLVLVTVGVLLAYSAFLALCTALVVVLAPRLGFAGAMTLIAAVLAVSGSVTIYSGVRCWGRVAATFRSGFAPPKEIGRDG